MTQAEDIKNQNYITTELVEKGIIRYFLASLTVGVPYNTNVGVFYPIS